MSDISPLESEPPEAASTALVYWIARENDPRRKTLLIRDLVAKASVLSPSVQRRIAETVLQTFAARTPPAELLMLSAVTHAPKAVDVVISAVVEVERRALLQTFGIDPDDPDSFEEDSDGRLFYSTFVESAQAKRRLRLVLTSLTEANNPRAAAGAARIKMLYEAGAYFVMGIAAGLKGRVKLGDVVVPRSVFYYEMGRETPTGVEPRPELEELDQVMRRNLERFDPTRYTLGWHQRLDELISATDKHLLPDKLAVDFQPDFRGPPACLISGEKLILNGRLEVTQRELEERVAAGDMEGYGVALGFKPSRWAIFRGISDYGELPKPDDWQYVASLSAAAALREFLEKLYRPPEATSF